RAGPRFPRLRRLRHRRGGRRARAAREAGCRPHRPRPAEDDGEDVIAAVRSELPKTKCIALTGVDIARVLGAMRAGASGYFLKPFHAADLARAVEEVLSGGAAPPSARAPHRCCSGTC